MPRRPRKQPRSSSNTGVAKKAFAPTKKVNGKIEKWVRREDIEADEEGQFHETRDRILLEGEDAEGGEEWGDGEEEVFGLGLDDNSEDDTHDGDIIPSDEEEEEVVSPASRKPKQARKSIPTPDPLLSSSDSESDQSESWGRTKSAYYASNQGILALKEGQEDEEEANAMEEREARRLQARMRETMTDEDYGLDDAVDFAADYSMLEAHEFSVALQNTIIPTALDLQFDKETALRRLEKTSPETLALAREWDDVVRDLLRIQQRLDQLESTTPDALTLGLSHLHHQTLLTYVTTLAFYLHLRAGLPATIQPQNQHTSRVKPVLERLLALKQALSTMEELDFDASDDEDEDESDVSYLDDAEKAELERIFGPGPENNDIEEHISAVLGRSKKLGLGELDALLREADVAIDDGPRPRKKAKTKEDAGARTKAKITNGIKPHAEKSTKFFKADEAEAILTKPKFDLVEPEFVPSTRPAAQSVDGGLETYGEATSLSMADDADKKARKRTLRFHTSKIESSARRREEGREKLGGDEDIPYRERKKEKEMRIRREVEKSRWEGGDDLVPNGDGDVAAEVTVTLGSTKRKRDNDKELRDKDCEEGEDGYYELVKRMKKERKEGKKREYEATRLVQRMDIMDDVGGPRSLTRAILKNKGLTPRRSKSVRNPRVKKRERFEKAKKRVRSQKAVYKEGLAGKPYGGEESGITKVVKSVKL